MTGIQREAIRHAHCTVLQSPRDLGLPDHAAAPVEPSGSGYADVVWTASEEERVGALADRRWAGRTATTHVPVRRHRARLMRRGQRRNVARNGCELGRDPSDYEALAQNDATVMELGDAELRMIVTALTELMRRDATVDWRYRESVRAALPVKIKRLMHKHHCPPDKRQRAVDLVIERAELWTDEMLAA